MIPTLLALAFSVAPARAIRLLDPKPEDSTTQFGRAVADIGDVDGDGVSDLAVGAPFQDGDFLNIVANFGNPQNVGKVVVLSGATHAVITQLNDPEFQLRQLQKFGGQFGWSLAPAGDVNGDGIPDVIVGAPHHVANPSPEAIFNAGRAFVFNGATGALLLTLDDPSPQENARAGFAIASVGDVNSDGVPDVLVGAPGKNIGEEEDGLFSVGIAYIYSGANGSLLRTLNHPAVTVDARFGSAVANAGDVDHDGVSDILIGAPGHGEVFVFSGKTGSLLFTLVSPVAEKQASFGFAVAGGKDLNNDGIPDFAIGAPFLNSSQGGVFLFSGSDGTLIRKLRVAKAQKFSKFGAWVGLTDDLTGDRRADVVVGAPQQDVNGLRHAGEAFVYNGVRGTVSQTLTSEKPQAFAEFGSVIATPDFNHDGTPTLVFGVPFQDADLVEDDDIVTHLQIGQIEIH